MQYWLNIILQQLSNHSIIVFLFLQFSSYIDNFFEDGSHGLLPLKKEDIYMGNLCAFQFWQRIFKVQPLFWYLFITLLKTLDASSFSMVVVPR